MRVLAIDPGLKNLGFALVVDGKLSRFGVMDVQNNVDKKHHKNYSYLMHRISRSSMFRTADVVVVERQMNQKMRCIATALICFAWPRGILVSPRSVKVHHGISMKNYRKNKAIAVKRAPEYMSKRGRARFRNLKRKQDDIADAVMMAMWYVETQGTEIPGTVSLVDTDSDLSDTIDVDIEEEEEEAVETAVSSAVVRDDRTDLIEINTSV